jgi:hypothetical protein
MLRRSCFRWRMRWEFSALSRLSERLGISPNSPSFIASYTVVYNFDFSQFEVAHGLTTPLISVASACVILLGLPGLLERAFSSTHELPTRSHFMLRRVLFLAVKVRVLAPLPLSWE